jgi:GDPmannose 4,6-dehydratase
MHAKRSSCNVGFVGLNFEDRVVTRRDLLRPAEVDVLLGDATKARRTLNWQPTITLEEMVAEMVEADPARHHPRRRP